MALYATCTQIPGCQTAYCKFEVVAGEDWQILDGMDNGITQVARQSTGVLLRGLLNNAWLLCYNADVHLPPITLAHYKPA